MKHKMIKSFFLLALCLSSLSLLNAQNVSEKSTDSLRQTLIGEWKYEANSLEMTRAERLSFHDGIPDFAKRQLSRVAGVEVDDSLKIKFTADEKFIISNSEEELKYRVIVYSGKLSISRMDYIITLCYEFDEEGKLILTSKPGAGEAKVKLKKE